MKNIKEMAYPVEFSFEKLLSLPSYAKRLAYVDSHLQKIGSGSARTVYKVDDEKVLKVAKNKKGLAQNRVESDYSLQNYGAIARVFDTSEKDIFLEMEYAKRLKPTEFKKIVGYSLEELYDFLRYYNRYLHGGKYVYDPSKPDNADDMIENEFINDIIDIAGNYDMVIPGDFAKISTYGKVMRNGEESVVIVDFGFTRDVYETEYKRNN